MESPWRIFEMQNRNENFEQICNFLQKKSLKQMSGECIMSWEPLATKSYFLWCKKQSKNLIFFSPS